MTWNRTTNRDTEGKTPLDEAFRLFENWAQDHGRNYLGDLVRDNLNQFLRQGETPQQAVDHLIRISPR